MAGLVLAIHVFDPRDWYQDVDARHKAGHDELCRKCLIVGRILIQTVGWVEPTGPALGRPDDNLRDTHHRCVIAIVLIVVQTRASSLEPATRVPSIGATSIFAWSTVRRNFRLVSLRPMTLKVVREVMGFARAQPILRSFFVRRFGSTSVAALISIVCWLLSLSPSLAQDVRVLDHLMWRKNAVSGIEIAGSQSKSSFNFFDVGDLSSNSQQLVEQDINRISSAAGLTVDRSSGTTPTLAIVHDSTAFSRLRNDKGAFRSLGIPESLLTKFESQISETSTCATLTLTDDRGDIRATIVLLSEKSSEKANVCLLTGLLNSFGINPIDSAATDIDARSLADACMLYEGRRLGLRDRESLTNNISKLQSLCLAKTGASK